MTHQQKTRINMKTKDKTTQMEELYRLCIALPADVRYKPEQRAITIMVPPPWDKSAEAAASNIQDTVKRWLKQYSDVVFYSSDKFSMLLYAP